MIKAIIKLAIVVLIANAIFQISAEYINHYRFNDSVLELATHASGLTDSQLKDKVMDLASTYSEPVEPDALTVRQEEHHTYVETKYTKAIAVVPGYEVQWPFALNVDGFVLVPIKAGDLANPK